MSCVVPSKVTALSAIALNQWPKSHHELTMASDSDSTLILSNEAYQASFIDGISLLAVDFAAFIGFSINKKNIKSNSAIFVMVWCIFRLFDISL